MNDTRTLIKKISKKAVHKRFYYPDFYLLEYLVIVVIYLGGVWIVGTSFPLIKGDLLLKLFFGCVAIGCTAKIAIDSSVPAKGSAYQSLMALFTVVLWLIISMALTGFPQNINPLMHGLECIKGVFGFLLAPVGFLLYIVWRGAPLRSGFSAFYAILSAGIVANLCMEIRCEIESTIHVFLFHILPATIVLSVGVWFFTLVFSWNTFVSRYREKISK